MGWKIRFRDNEACEDQPFLSPDLILRPTDTAVALDLAVAEAGEVNNRGGLRSKEGLHTSILIQLFTDARAGEDDILPDVLDPDPRGWWGDTVGRVPEQGEYNIGSHLWILRRSPLTEETPALAVEIVERALQPLIDQGAAAYFNVRASSRYQSIAFGGPEIGLLMIEIDGFDRAGAAVYTQKFEVLWEQIRAL